MILSWNIPKGIKNKKTQFDVETQVSLQRGQMGVSFDQIIVVEGIFINMLKLFSFL
jgi:hypothetical protein